MGALEMEINPQSLENPLNRSDGEVSRLLYDLLSRGDRDLDYQAIGTSPDSQTTIPGSQGASTPSSSFTGIP
ncbi:hypothetical protein PHISCL_03623 [Aspergillus sclerotialis]|uniref:Uncharacterized protein n=1 Tax=Aspergillus sclerotialis TaxID=2070753 RepID=A0A3A2ZLD5_9EURO|nr:hypothetical protein PHISCL_03623 [Aspergillus sclerotialis]